MSGKLNEAGVYRKAQFERARTASKWDIDVALARDRALQAGLGAVLRAQEVAEREKLNGKNSGANIIASVTPVQQEVAASAPETSPVSTVVLGTDGPSQNGNEEVNVYSSDIGKEVTVYRQRLRPLSVPSEWKVLKKQRGYKGYRLPASLPPMFRHTLGPELETLGNLVDSGYFPRHRNRTIFSLGQQSNSANS